MFPIEELETAESLVKSKYKLLAATSSMIDNHRQAMKARLRPVFPPPSPEKIKERLQRKTEEYKRQLEAEQDAEHLRKLNTRKEIDADMMARLKVRALRDKPMEKMTRAELERLLDVKMRDGLGGRRRDESRQVYEQRLKSLDAEVQRISLVQRQRDQACPHGGSLGYVEGMPTKLVWSRTCVRVPEQQKQRQQTEIEAETRPCLHCRVKGLRCSLTGAGHARCVRCRRDGVKCMRRHPMGIEDEPASYYVVRRRRGKQIDEEEELRMVEHMFAQRIDQSVVKLPGGPICGLDVTGWAMPLWYEVEDE